MKDLEETRGIEEVLDMPEREQRGLPGGLGEYEKTDRAVNKNRALS